MVAVVTILTTLLCISILKSSHVLSAASDMNGTGHFLKWGSCVFKISSKDPSFIIISIVFWVCSFCCFQMYLGKTCPKRKTLSTMTWEETKGYLTPMNCSLMYIKVLIKTPNPNTFMSVWGSLQEEF